MNIAHLYKIFKQTPEISTDSRNISENCIFFALKGENFDGNIFAQKAIDSGAQIAVISDKKFEIEGKTLLVDDVLKTLQELAKYHREHLSTKIFGITGTNGKTTTKELIFSVLSRKYKSFATQGNFNNHIGVPLTLLALRDDTDFAIVEMGANHNGEIAQLCQIVRPDFGLITNVGHAHLEGFGSFENLIETKLALFYAIESNKGTFLLNTNNDILAQRIKNYNKIFEYGKSADSFVKITESFNELFLKLVVNIKGDNYLINTQLVGKYNIDNVLAAISAGIVADVPIDQIVEAIEQYRPQNNRSEFRKTHRNTLILDMYNANPTSMKAAIDNFAEIDTNRKMLILGDMLELGQDEQKEHQKIVDLIVENRFRDVLLVGKIFKSCKLPEIFKSFDDVESLNRFLESEEVKGHSILLKASNGTGLKKCVEYL